MNKEEFRNQLLSTSSAKEILDLFRHEEATYFEL
jgi:mannitol/fructose-specific phosphotransferase system IIA component (Ntr-type)